MSDTAHVALIVEDDPQIAAIEKEIVGSLGHRARHAATLEEVRAALAEGGFCYVLLDMQIPADATSRPLVGSGETALDLLRRASPERGPDGRRHRVPILVVTGYSKDPDFVWKIQEAGADGFIAKPFGDDIAPVLEKIRDRLKSAGREDHAACGGPPCAATPTTGASLSLRLVISGEKRGRRTLFTANGKSRDLQDARFVVLLRLVVAHLRAAGSWCTATALGITRTPEVPSRIRDAFEGLVPEGCLVVESDRSGRFRLNPAVVVERVDWPALESHNLPEVQKIARDHRSKM